MRREPFLTKKIKRRLNIGDDVYYWVSDQNKMELYPSSVMHIRVHQDNGTKSILYIDANAWHFEISPQNIKSAIKIVLFDLLIKYERS